MAFAVPIFSEGPANFSSFRTVYNSNWTTNAENETVENYSITSFCSDLSFWNDSILNFKRDPDKNYTYLNGFENKDSCESEDYFDCQESKMCIPKTFTCDGSVNCKYAEDENFDLCKSTFPDGATVKCLEKEGPFYQIWIYAVPCDGILGKLI